MEKAVTLMAIWDDVLNEQDRKMFSKAKMGGKRGGLGKNPAIVVVDMTYGFVDSRFRLGCSESGYPVVKATALLLEKARIKKLYFANRKEMFRIERKGHFR
ncbi:hypothetical protein [Paenibacillus alginolyticus]|uniref:hypothetical protein n=1 Tax=Paenibacillus alginolyticus TaxID=59839 RepID=UPI002DBD57A7|nr:hypothetical protein [Paenibacillus alginolyticus]MEC0145211.1 hypothetical protein [Paenibacillus alginolyticus]